MLNHYETKELKVSIGALVESLEYLKVILGKSMERCSPLRTTAPVLNALHEVQVCTGQNIEALLKLDMVLEDLVNENTPE